MRKLWLAALLGLLVPTALFAQASGQWGMTTKGNTQTQVVGGFKTSDSTVVPLQFDGQSVRVAEQNPPQAFQVFQPSWLSTQLTARLAGGLPPTSGVFLQDSTGAVDVRGCNGLALMLYPTFDDSVSAVALALQIRWHYSTSADSQSTFIEQATRTFPMSEVATTGIHSPLSAAVRDSIGSLTWIPPASNGLSRFSVGAAAVANTDSLATPDETVIVLTNVSGVNRGRLIRINTVGMPAAPAGPFMSIRVRYLNGFNASGVAWGNGVSGFEPIMRLRADLIGWR